MAKQKDDALVKAFEEMYKYYKGWVFAYEYPGFFAYHQMGGNLSVLFTPDWNQRGKIPIQINNEDGEGIQVDEVPYEAPARNGIPYEKAEAWAVFRIVRPYLEKFGAW